MKLLKTDRGILLDVYVKPDSRKFKIEVEEQEFVVHCTESPVKGKVNKELIKELSRVFRRKAEMISGFTSKQKRILITDIGLDEITDIISKFKQES